MTYVLVWQPGLCSHGCGQGLSNPKRRFVNGHDAKLLDQLLDAHREGAQVLVRSPDEPLSEAAHFSAAGWAQIAFFPKGLRWFRIKAGIEAPGPEEIAGAEDPVSEHLDLGPVVEDRPFLQRGQLPAYVGFADAHSLDDDLATVREIVARAAESPTREAFERLEDELLNLRRAHEELTAHADLMEAELAAALESRTTVVTQDGLASLSDEQARSVMQARASAAKAVFSRARYNGDIREMQDLLTLFRSTGDPVRIAAMRALLGQAVQ